jgi:hypothetical protein
MIPVYRPFPVEYLPNALGAFVRSAAQAIGCDPSFVALPAIAACSAMIGNTRRMRVKHGWFEPLVIWANVVGVSGTGKSPGHAVATDAISEIEDDLGREFAAKVEARKVSESGDDDDEEPQLERVTTEDSTIEAVGAMLEASPRGMLLASEEIGQWYQSFGRYSKNRTSYDPRWLGMWEAKSVRIDRVTGPSRYIPRAFLGVAGAVQPGILKAALSHAMYIGGLVSRILFAMPPAEPIYWNDNEISEAAASNYADLLRSLRELRYDHKHGRPMPKLLMWSREARALFTQSYDALVREQAQEDDEHIRAAIGKLKNYLARFAALHHIVNHVAAGESDHGDVAAEAVEAAAGLCQWFAGEIRRVYGMLAADEKQDAVNKLVEIIRRKGGRISVRELQRANDRRFPTAEAAKTAMENLVQTGAAVWESVYPKGGGTPTTFVVLADDRHDNRPPGMTTDADFQANQNGCHAVMLSCCHATHRQPKRSPERWW